MPTPVVTTQFVSNIGSATATGHGTIEPVEINKTESVVITNT